MNIPPYILSALRSLTIKSLGAIVTDKETTVKVFGAYLPPPDSRLVSVRQLEYQRYFERLPSVSWPVTKYRIRRVDGPLYKCPDCDEVLVSMCEYEGPLADALAATLAEVIAAHMDHNDLIPEAQA